MVTTLEKDNFFCVRLAAFIAFVIPMIMTKSLWFVDRAFPLIPMFNFDLESNVIIDLGLIIAFVLSFIGFVFRPQWYYGIPILLIYTFLIIADQNRIQHFFFEIIFVVLALVSIKKNEKYLKTSLLLIFIGTYFWSGLHKYNDLFVEKWLNGLNKRIPFVPIWMRQTFTYAVPFLEASFGLGLVFVKTRRISIWLIAIMHAIILITLLKDGFGYVVFPLTVFNVFTLFSVFYNNKELSLVSIFKLDSIKKTVVMIFTIVLPVFNFFGIYDHIPSFSYFSGKPKYCRIHLSEKGDKYNLPNHVQSMVREYKGDYYIDLNEWSARTIRVLVYPEMRVYDKIKGYIEDYTKHPTTFSFY